MNPYLEDLVEKHIKIRWGQIKIIKVSDLRLDTLYEVSVYEFNTFFLSYFGQI